MLLWLWLVGPRNPRIVESFHLCILQLFVVGKPHDGKPCLGWGGFKQEAALLGFGTYGPGPGVCVCVCAKKTLIKEATRS